VTGLAALAPPRTPARPGPGPMPEAALRSLDLAVRRRVDGMLSGEFRSSHLGVATELAQVRPYQPGDDVRQMDWLATARTNEPHVRVHVAERALLLVVSDLRGPRDWTVPLARLSARHDVLIIEVRDPREETLEDAGELILVDPETGEQVRVDTRSRALRERYAEAAAAERAEVAANVRRAAADHVVLSTRGEWLRPLLVALARRERRAVT
jgi:uncharacterized protein (DUF58 family)